MTRKWLAGTAMAVLLSVGAAAQSTQGQVPSGETALGSVNLPRAVMANGQKLSAGAYQVRLTAEQAQPSVPGIQMERWVEFLRGGKAVGREVASIIPQGEMKDLQTGPDQGGRPGSGAAKVELLKGDEYLRVWINRGGVNYLVHLPVAK
ncbi:MAG TPA: hypothetical protein VL263_26245 [Vicinamibacterales bacterium]|jgi:hypothetical protein|nr:hypothetical protein [Vicinamibacterales bacterium]